MGSIKWRENEGARDKHWLNHSTSDSTHMLGRVGEGEHYFVCDGPHYMCWVKHIGGGRLVASVSYGPTVSERVGAIIYPVDFASFDKLEDAKAWAKRIAEEHAAVH